MGEGASKQTFILPLLQNNDRQSLEKLLTPESIEKSPRLRKISKYLNFLDYDKAVNLYGEVGISRFYQGLLASVAKGQDGKEIEKKINLDQLLGEESPKFTKDKTEKTLDALSWIAFPFKIMGKVYDYVSEKTRSHLLGYSAGVAAVSESIIATEYLAISTYVSYTLNLPLTYTLTQIFPFFEPVFLGGALFSSIFGAAFITSLSFSERRIFNRNLVSKEEIENDIRNLTNKFYEVWETYESAFVNVPKKEVTLAQLNAMYMLSTTNESAGKFDTMKDLRNHERILVPSIEKATGKKVSVRSIIHRCFDGVGGITLFFPSVMLGKICRNHAYGPIFVNKNRVSANPSYDFAVVHEFAHAAGAASEPMANYYALRAMDDLAIRRPLAGYDIYAATNRLCFAIGALREKMKNDDELFLRLRELGAPKFVYKAFEADFVPSKSPLPPIERMDEGPIESKFAGLYIASSYFASKMVEKGKRKLFRNVQAYIDKNNA